MVFPRLDGCLSWAKIVALCTLSVCVVDMTEASAMVECTQTVSPGDMAAGIQIITDTSCASGGLGCIDDICRFCKVRDTPQSSHLDSCSAINETPTCPIAQGDIDVGIQAIADSSCANGGLGCYNDDCRYCKYMQTPQSSHLQSCQAYGYNFPTPTPVAASVVDTTPCGISEGDRAVGIRAITDPLCLTGGLGCYNDHCRFCKDRDTPQSSHLLACSTFPTSTDTPASSVGAGNTGDTVNSGQEVPGIEAPVVELPPNEGSTAGGSIGSTGGSSAGVAPVSDGSAGVAPATGYESPPSTYTEEPLPVNYVSYPPASDDTEVPAYATYEPTPTETEAPIYSPTPVDETTAPVYDTYAPAPVTVETETPADVSYAPAPVYNTEAPTYDTYAPAPAETEAPAIVTYAPAPATETEAPVAETAAPAYAPATDGSAVTTAPEDPIFSTADVDSEVPLFSTQDVQDDGATVMRVQSSSTGFQSQFENSTFTVAFIVAASIGAVAIVAMIAIAVKRVANRLVSNGESASLELVDTAVAGAAAITAAADEEGKQVIEVLDMPDSTGPRFTDVTPCDSVMMAEV